MILRNQHTTPPQEPFILDEAIVSEYRGRPVNWGFGALSQVTYARTYSRTMPDGTQEQWWQTCRRVVEGTFTILRDHCCALHLPWDGAQAQAKAADMMARMFTFKFLPPGRGLWMMGTRFVRERSGAPLNSCAFRSTQHIDIDYAAPFAWTFEMLMLGVGVGFDTRGAGKVTVCEPGRTGDEFVVADSRQGWCAALSTLLGAFTGQGTLPARFNVARVRPRGAPINSFGGVASGPEPLVKMLGDLTALYTDHIGKPVDSALLVDTMNIVGACVVSGGVRRSAQIALGEPDDSGFMDLKLDQEKLFAWRWASNNSLFAATGMDYGPAAARTGENGEPGYAWLENMRAYGRMKDAPTHADHRVMGANPCNEQSLEDGELCCLVETFPAHHEGLEDFKATLKMAYMYAKAVTLVPTHDKLTNAIIARNRRIGCSMSGIVQAIEKFGYRAYMNMCDASYAFLGELDTSYSEWLAVPRSIKMTSVKPSGTVSLLAGATPGVHFDHAPFYIRRVRIADSSPIVAACKKAGYHVEPDEYSAATSVVSFPIESAYFCRGKADVGIWEKVDLAAAMQASWADNQVSCTVDFAPEEADQIGLILERYEDRLKGISFLPRLDHGYAQAPYEQIDEATYEAMVKNLTPIDLNAASHEVTERFCDGESCQI
jgi:adenosylcobalamin-dependent ribonucleoside-triphosphate reductase